MKAYVLNEAGGIENLFLDEIEQPNPKADEVLVKVKAISINPVDVKVRSTEEVLNMIVGPERPVILGWDIAGTVEVVGKNVTQFEPGDSVFGMVNFPGHGKGYAEFVAAPETHLAKMPADTSFEEAAATTLAAPRQTGRPGSHSCRIRWCRPLRDPDCQTPWRLCCGDLIYKKQGFRDVFRR